MQAQLTGSLPETAPRRRSQLAVAFGIAGALSPLLVLWSDEPTHGFHQFQAWGLSSALLSGLVSACVGVLLQNRRNWGAFLAVALGLGTAFATFVGSTALSSGLAGLPLLVPIAALCAAALTLTATGIFAAHRRLLEARAGSLVAAVDERWVWTVTGATVLGVACVVDLAARPSPVRVAIAAAAFLGLVASTVASQRRIAELRAVAEGAGARIEGRPTSEVLDDLGVGDDLWLAGPAAHAYRAPGQPLQVIRGSLRAALHHARRATRENVIVTLAGLLALLHIAWSLGAPVHHIAAKKVPSPAAVPAPPPVPTGSFYPDQKPILVDLDHDGVEDVISLRWNEADPERALFVGANDGATLRPLWATKRIPSQWMSPATHLVRSGSALFLTDSEEKLHIYDLETGRTRHNAIAIGSLGSLCIPKGNKSRLWWVDADAWRKHKAGHLVDADGHVTAAQRPKHCAPPTRLPMSLGAWDFTCSKKLRTPDLRSVTFRRDGDIGIGIGRDGGAPFAVGYDPEACARRWKTSLAFTSEALHPHPHLESRLANGRLYTLYQLDSGGWQVGARDAKTGRTVWHRALPEAERGTNVERLFVSPERVYVTRDWRLDVLDVTDGRYLGRM